MNTNFSTIIKICGLSLLSTAVGCEEKTTYSVNSNPPAQNPDDTGEDTGDSEEEEDSGEE